MPVRGILEQADLDLWVMENQGNIKRLRRAIAERVKALRKAAGLTQEQLAEGAGLGPEYISRLEAADRTPSLDSLVAISGVLGAEPADLMGRPHAGVRVERAQRLEAILNRLNNEDAAFLESQLALWVSHLQRQRG